MKTINNFFYDQPPVKIGERLIVMGRSEKVIVSDVIWQKSDMRWKIILDWGEFGTSYVWGDDEKKTWFKYSIAN